PTNPQQLHLHGLADLAVAGPRMKADLTVIMPPRTLPLPARLPSPSAAVGMDLDDGQSLPSLDGHADLDDVSMTSSPLPSPPTSMSVDHVVIVEQSEEPVDCPSPPRPKSAPPMLTSSEALAIRVTAALHTGPEARTFLGNILHKEDSVVVKIYPSMDRVVALSEASALVEAKKRAGDVVPQFLGIFGGNRVREPLAVVMRCCGKAPKDFDAISADDKISIRSAFVKLHDMGIEHRDVAPRNVVLDEKTGKWTVVDFAMADLTH
ncbi:hypothetical protein EXIGLDRAFT_694930, partial [Exidia glandulosa HHB12029]